MVNLDDIPNVTDGLISGRRLISSQFPPINLFDDVASAAEFEIAYAAQASMNPRLQSATGNLSLLHMDEIPFGITGCSYAVSPFTHVNPEGSRFSDGSFGILYAADTTATAIAEVSHHQQQYWNNVPELQFDLFVFRELVVKFNAGGFSDFTTIPITDRLYHPDSYAVSRQVGAAVLVSEKPGIQYHSVRYVGAKCWAMFTPSVVQSVIQAAHYEMVWSGANCSPSVRKISV